MDAEHKKPKAYITPHILTEYVLREQNPKWWMNFMADIALEEPNFFGWVNTQCKHDIANLQQEFPHLSAVLPLGVELDRSLRRMAIRGFYMGLRRYDEVNTNMMAEVSPLTNPHHADPDSNHGLPETWSEPGEFDPDDLDG